jgi:hypothetical protein
VVVVVIQNKYAPSVSRFERGRGQSGGVDGYRVKKPPPSRVSSEGGGSTVAVVEKK